MQIVRPLTAADRIDRTQNTPNETLIHALSAPNRTPQCHDNTLSILLRNSWKSTDEI
jgi:hypothetical protein